MRRSLKAMDNIFLYLQDHPHTRPYVVGNRDQNDIFFLQEPYLVAKSESFLPFVTVDWSQDAH